MKLLYDIILPRCPICNYSGKKVAIHVNEEHFKGSSADNISSIKPENDHATAEEFPSLALESGDGEEESERRSVPPSAKRPASNIQLAAKKSSFLSEWRCSIWEAFNRTLS